ncbi:MAG: replicative DNA helicase [Mycobacteriales bacterium]
MAIDLTAGAPPQATGSQFERTPPQNIEAEQCVLGGMLLSKDAIADVVETLRSGDFYRPAHSLVFDVVTDLYGRGEPADAVTVAAELQKLGQLQRIGGAPYLHTLVSAVPTAASAGYYAKIVSEQAILRRLVEAGTQIVQLGYGGRGADVDDIVDRAQQAVYDVTEQRASEDYIRLEELLQPTLDEIEAISSRDGTMAGVPTGFADLDRLTNGLHPGQLVILAARPAVGKALALDTPLPTPDGWTSMGDVVVGDFVLGADGAPTLVVAATDVMTNRPCYEVEFSDSTVIVADAAHQWVTVDADGRPVTSTTVELAVSLRALSFRPRSLRLPHVRVRSYAGAGSADARRFETVDGITRYVTEIRRTASLPVRCIEVDNADHLYLASRSMIPTHNSTLGLDFARNASIKHGMASVIFSLEMSRNEITMRLLSAEARVHLQNMRTGRMSDDDWARLARRMGEVASAPLYIDDSPNMTMMEIRAKARRLKQRHDLRLIVLDYMQLMSSPRKTENRQQEVSEISRSLKLLAKELEIPVVAISQLNRGPEQRADKKPQLSDLRESGCMTADTTLLRADTGAPISFRELLDNGHEGIVVWSFDENRRLVAAPVTKVFPSGVKPVFRLRLASGREVKASGNHPFLTFDGWASLETLRVGDRVAVPRTIPEPIAPGLGWSDHRLGLLAHLIGDGCVIDKQPVHYSSQDEANLAFVESAAVAEFGITPRRVQQGNWSHVYLPAPYRCTHGRYNPVHVWFGELGIGRLRSYEKRIPEVLYSASKTELAVFLRHLWATDGNVTVPKPGSKTAHQVYYSTSSRALADGVALLLGRFGIVARTKVIVKAGYERPGYHVIVADGPSLRVFCREIGVHGRRGEIAERLLTELADRVVNTNVDDALPREAWDLVRAERLRAGLTEREFQAAIGTHYCGATLYKTGISRERMLRIAEALDSPALRSVATDDVFWDRIVAIDPLGEEPVYDATVKGTHNFIADGVAAHNSLEQDADMVVLLYREDAFEKESPRAGEADFIVAKHRNGPTDTITVAFQGHYSRFVDMAPSG